MRIYHTIAAVGRLERLAQGASPVHRLHPAAKLLATAVFLTVVISFNAAALTGLLPFFLYPAALAALSGTPARLLASRLAAALPFILTTGLGLLLWPPPGTVSVSGIAVSAGLAALLALLIKTLLTVSAVLLLIATTPFPDMIRQLSRLRIPPLCGQLLWMSYRYLAVLLAEAAAMLTAYRLRLPEQKGIGLRHAGCLIGQLLLRSFDRAERIWQAMECRGFTGAARLSDGTHMRPRDWCFCLATAAAAVFFRCINGSEMLGSLFI